MGILHHSGKLQSRYNFVILSLLFSLICSALRCYRVVFEGVFSHLKTLRASRVGNLSYGRHPALCLYLHHMYLFSSLHCMYLFTVWTASIAVTANMANLSKIDRVDLVAVWLSGLICVEVLGVPHLPRPAMGRSRSRQKHGELGCGLQRRFLTRVPAFSAWDGLTMTYGCHRCLVSVHPRAPSSE
jgi:hypothetical protein